jgi:Fic family protein
MPTVVTPTIPPLHAVDPGRFDTPTLLKHLAAASRQLAELKGVASSIPNQGILVNSLALQEAKDSSAIENIVTTHDELFRDAAFPDVGTAAAKEVQRYRQALGVGYDLVRTTGVLTVNHILRIQQELERNDAGFRKVPGTTLRDGDGRVIYAPPQDAREIVALMAELERFIHDDTTGLDPLIRMALIHHQIESIHPFYDGNGRTGRIVNVLYLVKEGLLETPVLYMSRHIVRTKARYYELLQAVRERDAWEEWVVYMLTAVEETARDGITTIGAIKRALMEVKHRMRSEFPKIYSQDLINNLFSHPYTKIQFVVEELGVARDTATKYLEALTMGGILRKVRIGRSNFYINVALYDILAGDASPAGGAASPSRI